MQDDLTAPNKQNLSITEKQLDEHQKELGGFNSHSDESGGRSLIAAEHTNQVPKLFSLQRKMGDNSNYI